MKGEEEGMRGVQGRQKYLWESTVVVFSIYAYNGVDVGFEV